MSTSPQDQATTLAHISSLKMTQKDVLTTLNDQAHEAREAGDNARAKTLTQMSITLSQKNLVIHRAKQRALRAQSVSVINEKLKVIAAQSDQIRKDLKGVVDVLTKAAEFIDLLRRTIDVLT